MKIFTDLTDLMSSRGVGMACPLCLLLDEFRGEEA